MHMNVVPSGAPMQSKEGADSFRVQKRWMLLHSDDGHQTRSEDRMDHEAHTDEQQRGCEEGWTDVGECGARLGPQRPMGTVDIAPDEKIHYLASAGYR